MRSLQQDVRRLSAHLRAHGAEGDPDARRHRPDRRRPQPRVHHPGRDRRERRCSATTAWSTRTSWAADVDYERRPASRSSTQWTSLYAATDEMHDPASVPRRSRDGERVTARGIEVGHIFYFGTKYSKPMKARRRRPGRRARCRSRWAPTASACRAWSARIIEASHDDAGIIWPESVAPFRSAIVNLQRRRRRVPRRLRASSTTSCAAPGIEVLLRRPRRPAGRQIRRHGPDRHALAGDRRPQGPRRRQGRAQEPQDRRARGAAVDQVVAASADSPVVGGAQREGTSSW